MGTLVVTGWGHLDYAYAAAAAWRKYPEASIVGLSKRRLPEYLADLADADAPPVRLLLLGVSVAGNLDLTREALAKLSQRAEIHWISTVEWRQETLGDLGPGLRVTMGKQDGALHKLVGKALEIDVRDLSRMLRSERLGRGGQMAALIEAAGRRYRRIQDSAAYSEVIRFLAFGGKALPENLKRLLDEDRMFGDRELIGVSEAMASLRNAVQKLGRSRDCRVLIIGETGTGKETVAGLLHEYSSRRAEPMVCFNCADLSPQLVESRLFGHEKGAFTGATRCRPGAFDLANGGTLFLDEVAELSAETQAGLLRVLQEDRFYRLGGDREVEVNVRVLAATNRDLPDLVRQGRFREDLLFRLATVVVDIPPLRGRPEDIAPIANDFWQKLTGSRWLSDRQLADLAAYPWPGNVRELRNLLERAHVLDEFDFGTLLAGQRQWLGSLQASKESHAPDNLEAMTRLHVQRVLEKHDGNITQAAHALGLARNTVKKYLGVSGK